MQNNFFTQEFFKLRKPENAMEIPEIASAEEDFEELNLKGKNLCAELKRLQNIPEDWRNSLVYLADRMFTGNERLVEGGFFDYGPESKAAVINYFNVVKVLAQDARLENQDLTTLTSYSFDPSCAGGMKERAQAAVLHMRNIENSVNGGVKDKYQTRKETLIYSEVNVILNAPGYGRAGYGPDVHAVTRLKYAIAGDFGLEKPEAEFGYQVDDEHVRQIRDYVSSDKFFKDYFEGFESDIRSDCSDTDPSLQSQKQTDYAFDLSNFATETFKGIIDATLLGLGYDSDGYTTTRADEVYYKINPNLPYLVMLVDIKNGLKEGFLKPEVAKYTSPGMIKLAALVGQNVYEDDQLKYKSLKIEKTPITADKLIAKVQASTHKDRKEVKDAILEIEIEKKAQQCSALIMSLNDGNITRLAHLIHKHEKDGDRKYPAFFEAMVKDPDVKEKFVAVAREVKRLEASNSIQTTGEEIFYKMVDFFMWLFDKEIFDIDLAEREVFKNGYLTEDVSTKSFTEFVEDVLLQEQKAPAPGAKQAL